MREHPGYVLRATGFNTLRFFGVGPGHSRSNTSSFFEMGTRPSVRTFILLSTLLLAVLALAGGVIVLLRRRGPLFVWLVPLLIFATTAPIIGTLRYRSSLDPFLILLAVGGLSLAASRFAGEGGNGDRAPADSAGPSAQATSPPA